MKTFITITLLCFIGTLLSSQAVPDTIIPKRAYQTASLGDATIKVDGIIDEEAWNLVEWQGDFTVNRPNEGAKPSQASHFKIMYDEHYIYAALFCEDTAPDSIINRMSRRDGFPGDWITLMVDSYHDLRTAFSFTLSASGVRSEEMASNNGNNWDENWNPIWHAKTSITDKGWYGEMKIPFSQLRFGKEQANIWGLQVMRNVFRNQERSIWQVIPQKSGVWVSGFGEIHGIKDIQPRRQVEVAPYVVAKVDTYEGIENNPFATGLDKKITFGLDGKIAVTSNLILDYTVNPDFGQVEADPSRVRIDGFQNFFEERRPFFIESRNIFNYEMTNSAVGLDFDNDLLFYSRRIGSSPHGRVSLADGEYAQSPISTPILAAAKLSGKTNSGWSIGLLESITDNVYGIIDNDGDRRKSLIEPLTNYSVARIQKDIKGGESYFGGIVTAVNRKSDLNSLLHTNAYSGGLDYFHSWKQRKYYVSGNFLLSSVYGSKAKITETQTAFEHLFQRTNASETEVDTNRTSLTGTSATFKIGKSAGKPGKSGEIFKFESGITYRSPEFETNDIGFMLTANEINHFTWAGLQWPSQKGIFRSARINYNHNLKFDFGGQLINTWFNTNLHGNFNNNWETGVGFNYTPLNISNNALRGGSSLRNEYGLSNWFYVGTDSRKKMRFFFNGFGGLNGKRSSHYYGMDASIRYQPINALSTSLALGYNYNYTRQGQYVTQISYNDAVKTIVSQVSQNTLNLTYRLNYNITPDLTLQYYAQPYITRPLYDNFGYVDNPLSKDFDARFHTFSPQEITTESGRYLVDENRDGTVDYSFSKPDFNFVQFRSNLVARWEYKAGSELFLVWAHGNTPDAQGDIDSPLNKSLWSNILNGAGKNSFLIKATYRWLR
ncbi:MAG: DUF5916 domain-containing protein [Saprospiraceae bacterium]